MNVVTLHSKILRVLNRRKVPTELMIDWNKIQRRNPITNALAWYPNIVIGGNVGVDEVIRGIVEKCTLTKVDVKAVLIALEEVIIEQLKKGNSVRFGTLGSFRPTLKTRLWDKDKKRYVNGGCNAPTTVYAADGKTVQVQGVTTDNIAGIGVVFTKSGEMNAMLDRSQLQFRNVPGEKKFPDKA